MKFWTAVLSLAAAALMAFGAVFIFWRDLDEADPQAVETQSDQPDPKPSKGPSAESANLDLAPIESDFKGLLEEQLTPLIVEEGCPDRDIRLLDLQDIPTPASAGSGTLHGAWVEVTLMVQGPPPAAPEIHRLNGNGQGATEESARALARSRLLEQVVAVTRAALADCPSSPREPS